MSNIELLKEKKSAEDAYDEATVMVNFYTEKKEAVNKVWNEAIAANASPSVLTRYRWEYDAFWNAMHRAENIQEKAGKWYMKVTAKLNENN